MSFDFDYHMHTTLSDGQNTMEEMLETAHKIGLKRIGITDHFELYARNSIKVSSNEYSECLTAVKKLSENMGIRFYRGAETGIGEKSLLIPGDDFERDYTIASLHRMPSVEYTDEAAYWKIYRDMIENAVCRFDFDILGHVEGYLPIKGNRFGKTTFEQRRQMEKEIAKRYFPLEWYDELAVIMRRRHISIEIHGASDSPRMEVLELMKRRGVKFSFGSDAHTSEQMGKHRAYLVKVIEELKLCEDDFPDLD